MQTPQRLNSAELRLGEVFGLESISLWTQNRQHTSPFTTCDGYWKLTMAPTVRNRCSASLSAELPPMRWRLGIRLP